MFIDSFTEFSAGFSYVDEGVTLGAVDTIDDVASIAGDLSDNIMGVACDGVIYCSVVQNVRALFAGVAGETCAGGVLFVGGVKAGSDK